MPNSYRRLADLLGSTAIVADASGTQVGEVQYKAWGCMGAAALRPALGRFVQPDTVVAEPSDAQGLNRSAYVRNNPLRYTDPTGHAYDESGAPVDIPDEPPPPPEDLPAGDSGDWAAILESYMAQPFLSTDQMEVLLVAARTVFTSLSYAADSDLRQKAEAVLNSYALAAQQVKNCASLYLEYSRGDDVYKEDEAADFMHAWLPTAPVATELPGVTWSADPTMVFNGPTMPLAYSAPPGSETYWTYAYWPEFMREARGVEYMPSGAYILQPSKIWAEICQIPWFYHRPGR